MILGNSGRDFVDASRDYITPSLPYAPYWRLSHGAMPIIRTLGMDFKDRSSLVG